MTSTVNSIMRNITIVFIATLTLLIASVPFSSADSAESGFAYDGLDSNMQRGYDALDYAAGHNRTSTSISYLTVQQGHDVMEAYYSDHPEMFWLYDNFHLYTYTGQDKCSEFRYIPTYTQSQISTMQDEIDEQLKGLTINGSDSDHKKLRAIHDWLAEHITYTSDAPHEGDIYGAIALGKCVCEGYAQAFNYLCKEYGFKCLLITGYTYSSSTVGHAWNLVYGEGAWYFVDVTWDDDERYSAENDYFMVGSDTKVNGYVFATENHLADSLYGITPATSKYISPEQRQFGMMLYGGLGAIAILYVAFKIYKHRKAKRELEASPYQDNVLVNRCPQCGSEFPSDAEFCPACGNKVNKE